MIWMVAALATEGTGHVTLGNRLDADGTGMAAGVAEEWVVGGDGGVLATRISGRWANEDWVFAAHLPFATYRVPGGRTTGLGNLRLDAMRRTEAFGGLALVGIQVHLPVGRAYTWTNTASSIWPGGGLTAVVQVRKPMGTVDLLGRAAVGLHGTGGFDPYPALYLHASAAGGVDKSFGNGLGVTGEAALSVWDPSPIEAAGFVRFEPESVQGFRVRTGLLLPLGTWMGLSPSDKPAGVRELTLSADISLAL